MLKRTALLGLIAFLSAPSVAMARGGRTTAADCAAGSDDPDCPDSPEPAPASSKPAPPGGPGQPSPAQKR